MKVGREWDEIQYEKRQIVGALGYEEQYGPVSICPAFLQ